MNKRIGLGPRLGLAVLAATLAIIAHRSAEAEEQARPARDRAVFAKAGDTEYYLRLPDNLCALNDAEPADRKFVDEFWAGAAKRIEAAKATKPMSKDLEQAGKGALDFAKLNRIILRCDQLEKLRAGGERQTIQTYVTAMGMQKDRYDPYAGAGGAFASLFMCGVMRGDVFKWSDTGDKDRGGVVADAFKRLEGGEAIALRTELEFRGCYLAWIAPRQGNGGTGPPLQSQTGVYLVPPFR